MAAICFSKRLPAFVAGGRNCLNFLKIIRCASVCRGPGYWSHAVSGRLKSSNDFDVSKISFRGFNLSPRLFGDITLVKCPQLSESLSEGDVRLLKNVGDQVEVDEVVCEVETDKTSIPIYSPVAGVIDSFLVEDGSTVKPGQEIVKIIAGAGQVPKTDAPLQAAKPKENAAPIPPVPSASEPPSPPAAGSTPVSAAAVSSITIKQFGQQHSVSGSRTESRVKMNRMRQRIAQRLKDAQNTYAMLTTFNEVDMTNITALRAKHKEAFAKKHNVKLGFMSAFVKACADALQDQPIVNAVIDDASGEIVYRDYIDISVAVSTPKGLVVPIIRDVQNMSYADIEKSIAALGEKARTGSLAIEDMDGGTFTISNGGVFGSMFGTPIINPPQSSILGMHAIMQRPVAVGGKVEIRPMMYICLTYDHRLIDGREAVTFLKRIKEGVEDPAFLLIGI